MIREEPCAILGLFDISRRCALLAQYLSLTMPYCLWEGLAQDLDKRCLTLHSWRAVEKR